MEAPPAPEPISNIPLRAPNLDPSLATLKPAAQSQQAIVRAEVSAASVVSVSGERVELLLYVNQYRRNAAITGEKVDQNQVVLAMARSGGTCKVSGASAI